jgi:peptidoglycan/xylan/chitin deacetylase (PgdA/CDA1 family)
MDILHRTPCWRPFLHGGCWRLPPALAHLGGQGRVLLTFDDGPSPATALLARELEKRNARALFFLLGDRLPEDPATPESPAQAEALAITRALLQAGHLPAVHGLRHERQAWRTAGAVTRDFNNAARRIEAACGMKPVFARPPYGSWSPWLGSVPRRTGLELLFWSFNPFDYKGRDPRELARLVGEGLRAGDILLLHCTGAGQEVTRAALPEIVTRLRDRGLACLDPLCLLETGHA